PAMNTSMFQHPATTENLATLARRGVEIVGPGEGRLACGEVGPGRLAEVDDLFAAIARRLARRGAMAGRTVLVTAGPTREFLDPVRFLSNPSTGRMGYALAREAAARGAKVVLVSGPTELAPPPDVECVSVIAAAEMLEAVQARFAQCHLALFAAAPADYRPARRSAEKTLKGKGGQTLELALADDVAAWAGKNRQPGQTLVLFAAETHEGEARAAAKLKKKNHDFVVLNDVSRSDIGFASAENEAVILGRAGERHLIPKQTKERVAAAILDFVAKSS
ncbi:MAG: bifunctional phosphopantothenoylcysteine decarboxylase/phosphopantothenate--cysteine ligase CoaBC, partial [Candidatus Sumerlaeota bacterium]|nr:bifunctional phosphopantothenoylcysteine decarboxylase/phosphopantothenate--cysteine ligase CoaBC [Candidatus Sumerlaeota bacterium]